ncbi:hypothetical protein DFH11DRAFT_1725183 [Phellopilus nigrolimitatus]|nr:hypothetical protein DFH11DRAFT_1725183 [Phellopilus nigrolimitatus]
MSSDTTVSLEPHLVQVLTPLLSLLPPELCNTLATELGTNGNTLLFALAHISMGADRLRKKLRRRRKLDYNSYHMVSLLAGTRTAPSSKPPPYTPPESPEARGRREWNDRKALTAVLNGVLSVGCAGGAAWWAADKAGWRDEWKVLLALVVAAGVGLSETVLFIIWQSRSSMESKEKIQRRKAVDARKKSDDSGEPVPEHTDAQYIDTALRRRIAHKIEGLDGS